MSGFQLAASLVSSLAWPVVIVVGICTAWIKRRSIIDLINTGGIDTESRKLKRVKAGPIELEWEALVQSTAEQVNRAIGVTVPEITSSAGSLDRPSPPVHDNSGAGNTGIASEAIAPISKTVPTAVVLEEFARIESRLIEMLDDAGVSPPERATFGMLNRQALDAGLISKELADAINSLVVLRNVAAHRVGRADISIREAREYLDLAERVLTALGVRTGMTTEPHTGFVASEDSL